MDDHRSSLIEELAKKAEEQDQEAAQRRVDAFLTRHENKASTYQRSILAIAYGGFFGLWQLTKDIVESDLLIWSALLFSISAAVFVFYEVYKTIVSSQLMITLNGLLAKEDSPSLSRVDQLIGEANVDGNRLIARIQKAWIPVMVTTLLTGVGGLALLMSAFVRYLLADVL